MAKIDELIPDPKNANKGTQRGLKALDDSLRNYGAGRSILLDRDNRVIAGNKTLERWADISEDEEVLIIESDGHKLIAVRRTDLDLEDDGGKARALATYDNRVGQLDLDWDLDALSLVDADVLDKLGLNFEGVNYNELWQGMPEFEQEDKTAFQSIHIHFKDQEAVDEFAKLINQNITNKTRSLWYPNIEIERYADKRYIDES